MDGIAAVQARIASIESRFHAAPATVASAGGDWTAAASAAGTLAPESSAQTSFATALRQARKSLPGGAITGAGNVAARSSGPAVAGEARVVAEARKYLGIPYLWGGTDPAKGLDCSGLTQLVYKNLGVDIPRVSYEQATAGRAVASLDQARPGDLVFYDNSSSRPGIDHVALYIGGGKIIEAPRTGLNVRVTDVGDPVAIRRVLPESAPAPVSARRQAVSVPSGLRGVPYADLFVQAGATHGVPAALLAAVAKTESGFNPQAVSPAGARGLMQFMPGTADELGVDPLRPAQAVDGAARYLATHLRDFGSVDLALAAYNAGPGAVRKYDGVPPYEETQNYVRKVTAAWKDYR